MPSEAVADVDLLSGVTLHPTQYDFLRTLAPAKAYIGPFGSGKTRVLAVQAMVLSHYFVPNNGLIGRLSYPDLRDTTRQQFMDYVPKHLVREASLPEKGDGYVEWNVGGRTLFRNLDQPNKFGSLNLGYAGIDEAAELQEMVFNAIEARVGRWWKVSALPKGVFPYSPIFAVGNPGGQDWIYKRFFKPGRTAADAARSRGFQPGARENEAFLPPGYYDNLAKGKPEWWIRRFLRGDMRALEGLVFPLWDDTLNVVRPFPIPPEWRRVMSLDHGQRNPTAVQWWAVDTEGNFICYRDYEVAGPTIPEHAAAFSKLERRSGKETIEYRVADPSIFNKTISGRDGKWHSVADEYADLGFHFQPGDNAVAASLARCNVLLWADPAHRFPHWHPKAGQKGSPRAFFFDVCERAAEAISSWKFKDFKGSGLGLREDPVDVDDHHPDAFRYMATSFPEPTIETQVIDEPTAAVVQIAHKKAIGRELRKAMRTENREAMGGRDDYA